MNPESIQTLIERERERVLNRTWQEKVKDFMSILWAPYQSSPEKNTEYRRETIVWLVAMGLVLFISVRHVMPGYKLWHIFMMSIVFLTMAMMKVTAEWQRAVVYETARTNDLIIRKMSEATIRSIAAKAGERVGRPVDPNPISVVASLVDELEARHQQEIDLIQNEDAEQKRRGLFDDFLDETDTK